MPTSDAQEVLRRLPSVDEVLRSDAAGALLGRHPRWAVVAAVREAIDAARARLRAGEPAEPAVDEPSLERAAARLTAPSLRRVVNATGVVLHTNLGRAPLPPAAVERVAEVCRGYSNLEYDLAARKRGSRHAHVAELLSELCGAEAACVVNNNAAAVLLVLSALADGREVIVSRGELVEIGGSFRIPDVMRASGAILREVGTTNKTHPRDYRDAAGDATALLLKVHRSNFAVVGFVAEVSTEELAAIARERRVPAAVDLGSGSFADLARFGLPHEPTPAEAIGDGADLVTFSGDKLLGGPQAGVIVGRADLVERCRKHPLMRALRPDKMTLAALEATLELYRDGRATDVPIVAMLAAAPDALRARAERLAEDARAAAPRARFDVVAVKSQVGGGALPLCEPESFAVAVAIDGRSTDDLEAALRAATPPVLARIEEGRLLLDVRCLAPPDERDLVAAIREALR